ncbi:MAG: hypothetical protein RLZZ01_410, partial [Actinomycetota bacterium]
MTKRTAIRNTAARHRRLTSLAVLGATLLSPVLVGSSVSHAEAPSVSVTGLTRGDRGDSVRSVQSALVAQGIAVAGGVDGIFGPGTEAAVSEFQGRVGLSRTGRVDEATAIALGLLTNQFY